MVSQRFEPIFWKKLRCHNYDTIFSSNTKWNVMSHQIYYDILTPALKYQGQSLIWMDCTTNFGNVIQTILIGNIHLHNTIQLYSFTNHIIF